MTCSLRTRIIDRLELEGMAEEQDGVLVPTAHPESLARLASVMAAEFGREFDAPVEPFALTENGIELNEQLIALIENERYGAPIPVDPDRQEKEGAVLSRAAHVMGLWGISYSAVSKLRDRDGNPIKGLAFADLINRAVQVLEGHEEELTEEIVHFYVAAMRHLNEPLFLSMAERVHLEPEHAEVREAYADLGYSEEDIQDEAITKVILSHIGKDDRNTRWWERVLRRLKELLIGDPFKQAAVRFMRDDMSVYADAVSSLKRETLMRSVAGSQERVRELLIKMASDLEPVELKKESMKEKISEYEMEALSDTEVLYRYKRPSDGKIFTWRATDRASINFMRNSGARFKKLRRLDTTRLAADIGTAMHVLMEDMVAAMANEEFADTFNVVDLKGREKMSVKKVAEKNASLGPVALSEAETSARSILTELKERAGTGKMDLYLELSIASEKEDTAGTIDLLAVDSSGNGHIRDYKFSAPKGSDREWDGSRYQLSIDPFSGEKRKGYEQQQRFYARALRDVGVNVKSIRLIPGMLIMKKDKTTKEWRVTQVYLTGKKYMDPIPMSGELLGEATLDAALQKLYSKIEDAEKKAMTPTVYRELATLRALEKDLLNKASLSATLEEIKATVSYMKGKLREPEKVSNNDLQSALELLETFVDIRTQIGKDPEALKHLDDKTAEKFRENMDALEIQVNKALGDINNELEKRLTTAALERGVDISVPGMPIPQTYLFNEMKFFDIPIFKFIDSVLGMITSKVSMKMTGYRHTWNGLDQELMAWGKSQGLDSSETYRKLVRKTRSGWKLNTVLTDAFRAEHEAVIDRASENWDGDLKEQIKWMQDRYVAVADFADRFKKKQDRAIERFSKMYGKGTPAFQAALKGFNERNDLLKSPKAWVSGEARWLMEMKPEVQSQYQSEEYRYMLLPGNEPLLKYYNAWKEHMNMLSELVHEAGISPSMIPSMISDHMEALANGKLYDNLAERFSRTVGLDETVDEQVGTVTRRIPLKYMHPPLNRRGEMDPDLLTTELTKVMIAFTESVLEHHEKSEAEALLLYAQHWYAQKGQQALLDNQGRPIVQGGEFRTQNVTDDVKNALNDFLGINLYGLRDKQEKVLGISSGTIRAARDLQRRIVLTFPVRAALASLYSSTLFRAGKNERNQSMSWEAEGAARKLQVSDHARYVALTEAFDIYQENHVAADMRNLSKHRGATMFDGHWIYGPLVQSDNLSGRAAMANILANHALVDGKLVRSTENSLLETLELNEDGTPKVSMEIYNLLRRKYHAEMEGLTGMAATRRLYEVMTIPSLLMDFKSWGPNLVRAAYGDARYDAYMEGWTEGKYSAGWRALFPTRDSAVESLGLAIKMQQTLSSLGRGVAELAYMGRYTLAEKTRAKLKAENKWPEWKEKAFQRRRAKYMAELERFRGSSTDPKVTSMGLEEFMEMREGSIRAAMTDLRGILFLFLLGALFSALDDDDERTNSYAMRKTNDILARVLLETASLIDPREFLKLNRGAVPLLNLIQTLILVFQNGADEMHDVMQNGTFKDKGDRTGPLHYTVQMLPYVRPVLYWTDNFEAITEEKK